MELKTTVALIMTIFIVIYFIYDLIRESHKSRKLKSEKKEQNDFFKKMNDQLMENSLVNQEILKYLKVSCQKYAEEITDPQARIVIDSVFSASQFELYNYISKIIKENNIKGNEKEITSKIKLFVNNRLHKDYLLLKEFKYKEKNLSDFPINDWKEYLIENMINSVLREKGDKSLFGVLQNAYDSIKYDILEKILS